MTIVCVAVIGGAIAWRILRRWPERRVLRMSVVALAAVGVPVVLSLSGYGL